MRKIAARRSLQCPRCDGPIDVGAMTKSTVCPGCARTIRTEDETVADYQARAEYFNEARVEVARKGIIIGEVRVRRLVVKGEVRGNVRSREGVHVNKTGRLYGDVRTPRLEIEEGAILVGRVEIAPLQSLRKPVQAAG
ncbi:MAG: polymer-forming cytoskeletal protein [Planctomycetes bacterium]|nr:polymer-forming cytoskeletal protein [Planctomycetota bacterium]